MRVALLAVSLSLIACGAVPPPAEIEQADTAAPVIAFAADFSVTQSAPLVAGQRALLRYDPARLPRCRAIYHGLPAWAIQASWAADGGAAQNDSTMRIVSGGFVPTDIDFTVPFGRDLAVWFFNSDEYGCRDWDSDYGRNYHFPIEPNASPVIHLRADWSVALEGTPRAGTPLVIDYDLHRLPFCRQDYNGYQTWDVVAHARFDDRSTADASVTRSKSDWERVQAAATLATPAGAHRVELWFDNSDRTGCHTWDSDYGRNFTVDLR